MEVTSFGIGASEYTETQTIPLAHQSGLRRSADETTSTTFTQIPSNRLILLDYYSM